MLSDIKELYLVFEDYMGKRGVVGIFKDITVAKYFNVNTPFSHIKKIYTDIILQEQTNDSEI